MEYEWPYIEKFLDRIQPVSGGFTKAIRGFVQMPKGKSIFIKLGVDDDTRKWAQREVAVYRFLEENNFPHIPKLLSVNQDETGFALSSLRSEDGWNWEHQWNEPRLKATLHAMDVLAALKPSNKYHDLFAPQVFLGDENSWTSLINSNDLQSKLLSKLEAGGYKNMSHLNFQKEYENLSDFRLQTTDLVHDDVRSDNCAWNPNTNKVCLVDWNWAHIGDRRIDTTATMINVHLSGFDISNFTKFLDKDALNWLAGFWLSRSATPGPEKLRQFQLTAGTTAFDLCRKL